MNTYKRINPINSMLDSMTFEELTAPNVFKIPNFFKNGNECGACLENVDGYA